MPNWIKLQINKCIIFAEIMTLSKLQGDPLCNLADYRMAKDGRITKQTHAIKLNCAGQTKEKSFFTPATGRIK